MAEIPTVTPKEVVIALVSGFGNTEARVKEPHDEAAANLEARGFTVVRVDPDYSKSGRPDDARGEIRQARTQAVDDGMRFVSWGTSGGGTVATAERIQYALENGIPLEELGAVPLSDRGITVCSRRDFLHHPDRYGDIYPHEGVIRASSPVLEEAVEIVSTNLGRVVFSSDDTWCLSAGSSDKRIPPASSFLPNAKVTFIGASNGTRLTHDGAVEKSLSSPVYRDRVANFAVGKAA